jgi:hypothetical protein
MPRRPQKRTAERRRQRPQSPIAIDPLVGPGNPSHRHPSCAKTHQPRSRHCMVHLATRTSSHRSQSSHQTEYTTVMLRAASWRISDKRNFTQLSSRRLSSGRRPKSRTFDISIDIDVQDVAEPAFCAVERDEREVAKRLISPGSRLAIMISHQEYRVTFEVCCRTRLRFDRERNSATPPERSSAMGIDVNDLVGFAISRPMPFERGDPNTLIFQTLAPQGVGDSASLWAWPRRRAGS